MSINQDKALKQKAFAKIKGKKALCKAANNNNQASIMDSITYSIIYSTIHSIIYNRIKIGRQS